VGVRGGWDIENEEGERGEEERGRMRVWEEERGEDESGRGRGKEEKRVGGRKRGMKREWE
jgi:hypothetical protein